MRYPGLRCFFMKIRNKAQKIAIIFAMLMVITFSLFRFYNTGIRLGMGIATSQPRGDFVGVFPVYWAWKLNPKLISQNFTTIDEMNKLASPNFSTRDFIYPYSVGGLCRLIEAGKYDLPLTTADNTIERLNELLEVPDFFDKLCENNNCKFSQQALYFADLTKEWRRVYLSSFSFSENEFKWPLVVEKLCEAVNAGNYRLRLKSKGNTIDRLNEILKIPDLYEKFQKKNGKSYLSEYTRYLTNKTSEFRNKNFPSLNRGEQKYIMQLNRRLLEENYTDIIPKSSFFSDKNSYWQQYIKILNRLILEETFPSETPKMQRMWHYGPTMHFLTFPLIFNDSYKGAFRIWLICCIILLWISIYLWYRMLSSGDGSSKSAILTMLIFVWFNFAPLYEGFITGVIEILELFLLTLSFYFLSKKREALSGVSLGFAAMTKFLPAIFIPYFLLKKKYKLFAASMITCILLALLTEFMLGWRGNAVFSLLKISGKETWGWFYIQSIPNLINRLYSENFGYGIHTKLLYPDAARITSYIVISAIMLFYAVLFIRKRRSRALAFEISILSILMIAITQHSHYYYLLLLLIPFSLGLQYLLKIYNQNKKAAIYDILVFSLALLLVGVIVPMTILHNLFSYLTLDFLNFYFGFSLPCWGYLILLGWFTVKYIKTAESELGNI